MKLLFAISLACALAAAAGAQAQSGPSFDCAKASNAIERTICKTPELAKVDREMASLYAALLGRLNGAAKENLEKNQLSWIVSRNRSCGASEPDAASYCLKKRYEERIADLKASGSGPYPFVEAQTIEKKGTLGKVSYSIDILYPRFVGTTADFRAINRSYAETAAKAAGEATPTTDAGLDRKQEWSGMGSYTLYRPGPDAVTVASNFWSYTGGAHGYGAVTCRLVDLRTGKALTPEHLFADEHWLRELVTLTAADLKKQFVENPGFDDALKPASLTKLLRENGHYCWQAGKLELYFNAYEVGPYAAGPYTVEIPYARLRRHLRADAPLAF